MQHPSRQPFTPRPLLDSELARIASEAESTARPSTRLKACLFDALAFSPVPIGEAIRSFLSARGAATPLTNALMWLELVLGLAILGSQWFLIATTGQSLGKRWCRIKIVRSESHPVGFVHGVLLREWVRILVGFVPFVGMALTVLDDLFVFRADRRCLHDLIAGTRVIDVR